MMDSIYSISGAIAVAIIASIPGLLAYRNQQRRTEIEYQDTVAETALSLIGPLRQQVDILQTEVEEHRRTSSDQQRQIDRLSSMTQKMRTGIRQLIHQLQSHNIDPVWELDPEEFEDG